MCYFEHFRGLPATGNPLKQKGNIALKLYSFIYKEGLFGGPLSSRLNASRQRNHDHRSIKNRIQIKIQNCHNVYNVPRGGRRRRRSKVGSWCFLTLMMKMLSWWNYRVRFLGIGLRRRRPRISQAQSGLSPR